MGSPSTRRIFIAIGVLAATVLTLVVAGGGAAPKPPAAADVEGWVGTWAAGQAPAGLAGISAKGFNNQTIRMTIRTSVGGDAMRVRLSNNFGTAPLTIGRATVALPVANDSPQVDLKTLRELTFSGHQGVTIPTGGQIFSDPLTMSVPPLQELTISIFLPAATGPATFHFTARETSFFADGDQVAKPDYAAKDTRPYWFFLSGVDVHTRRDGGAIVVIGDSIADGVGSTMGLHRRWPDYLAARLINDTGYGDHDPGVLNVGMAGSALTHDGAELKLPELGVNGLARFYRDVPGQTGVRTVILALGVNDIQFYNDPADRIIDGLRQLATQARQLGLRVVACTVLPFEGFTSWTPGKETTRGVVNSYIRDSNLFDGVLDFDAVLRDPAQPSRLRAESDSGDHIHPNDAGYEAMAKAVPLRLFY